MLYPFLLFLTQDLHLQLQPPLTALYVSPPFLFGRCNSIFGSIFGAVLDPSWNPFWVPDRPQKLCKKYFRFGLVSEPVFANYDYILGRVSDYAYYIDFQSPIAYCSSVLHFQMPVEGGGTTLQGAEALMPIFENLLIDDDEGGTQKSYN